MMSVQKKTELFFNLKPVEYDLGRQRTGRTVIRPLTVNARLNIKEEHIKAILNGIDYNTVISKINFPADKRAGWLRACLDK